MPVKRIATLTLCALLTIAAGCKKSSTGTSSNQPQKNYTTIDWANSGTISGTVHFTGKAPKRIPIDMGQDPVCSLSPTNLTEQYVVDGNGLENVFVAIKSGLGDKAYAPPSKPVVMDQKGCRYDPHVIGVMAGQPIEFTNSDNTMHNVHMIPTLSTNQSVDVSEAPNGPGETRTLSTPELMIPVRCNNHPWMEAFVNVVSNPFYAVSGEGGKFTIKGVPPGTYTIVTDHEKLGEKTATVTVQPHQTATVDVTYQMPAATK
ncbi:MAG TPA: carboxypeptidase regulatory-like domain-containing protein [Acidobacteriaceae bacterium]|nr:carboxypeptidase regulatory-like domain-containing protein [Acidobacteriaceae bacterium]